MPDKTMHSKKTRPGAGSGKIDRRQFLSTTAAAGAGLMLSPAILRRVTYGKTDDLHVAIIGVGAQGQVLLSSCLKIPNLRFRAVCDIWREWNLKRAHNLLKKYRHDANAYEDYEEMLASEKDLDAVIIATPDFWHARHAIACLEAGLHVYLEKEMSNTLEGARSIVEAVRRTGKLLQVGHQRRSNPWYLYAYRKLIKEMGAPGRITTVNGQWNRSVQPDNLWPPKYAIPVVTLRKYGYKSMHQYRNWRWYKGLGGGPIVDLGSHQLDIYNWFLESTPDSVIASGGTDYYDPATHEWYDTVLATFVYETQYGVVRAFYQTITTNSNQGYHEVFLGDQAALVVSESAAKNGIYPEPNAPAWDEWVEKGYLKAPTAPVTQPAAGAVLDVRETIPPPKYTMPVQFNDPYHKPHLENFFNAIRGLEPLNCPVDVGYETAVTVLRVNEAVESGRKIRYRRNEFKV